MPEAQIPRHIEPKLQLTGPGNGRIGSDRLRLLEAIRDEGSIAKAAKLLGISYKAAWDSVHGMNNLFSTPVIERQAGGAKGGSALLTPRGEAVLAAMQRVMVALDDFAQDLTTAVPSDLTPDKLWKVMMKTSARNTLHATISAIRHGGVNAEVEMDLGDDNHLVAIVTEGSIDTLGLAVGRSVIALIKSSFIILCPPEDAKKVSARNRITGKITHVEPGAVNSEIIMDIGGGKTLAAIVTEGSAQELGYREGTEITALIKASHVIIGVD